MVYSQHFALPRFVNSHCSDSLVRPVASRKGIFCLSLLFLSMFVLPALCEAEESPSRIQGYVFAAPGFRTHEEVIAGITHLGGGGDFFISNKIAAQAEIGYLRPWKETVEDIGLLSMSGIYNFSKRGKTSPFVFAGVSFGLRDKTLSLHLDNPQDYSETLTLLNFGFGATYWFQERKGFRFEVRDHLYTAETDRQYLEMRFSFVFR